MGQLENHQKHARALRAEIDEVLAFVGFRWDRETGTTSEKPRA